MEPVAASFFAAGFLAGLPALAALGGRGANRFFAVLLSLAAFGAICAVPVAGLAGLGIAALAWLMSIGCAIAARSARRREDRLAAIEAKLAAQ